SAYLLRLDSAGKELDRWTADARPERRIRDSTLRTITRGPAGEWWLLGADALYRQDAKGAFEEIWGATNTSLVTMVFQGERLWLAADSTLEAFRMSEDGLVLEQRYTAGDGLPPGRVQALVPGEENLWLLMSIGLARLDPTSGKFRLFSGREGLMQSEFNPGAAVELGDGRFAAGTNNGLLIVDPARIQPVAQPPPVHLTSLRAGDRVFGLDRRREGPLSFGWQQNSLEFSFIALSYINPAQNRYRSRLAGWEDEWQEGVGQTTRFFSSLPSGDYEFEVQAANVDGIWNRAGDRVAFSIAPPPWRSAPAWLIYALIVLAAGVTGWRALITRRARRESLRRAREQQQLADRQRKLLEQLNRSLEPGCLARTLGEAVLQLAGVSRCHVGFTRAGFPGKLWSFGDFDRSPERARFDAAVAASGPGEVLLLGNDPSPLAAVWLPGLDDDRGSVLRGRLDLFAQTAGQVLENARLLLDVRKLARKANEASEAKSEFLATMSHEIRTPLHGLLGMMELFEHTETNPAQLDMLRTMRGSGRQLQRILNDVLDLSRI
ncbi:MAG: histidine kinase dimerization/phospho-acceptor domain-containing protein, partial [Wenzhouxiangellaceae bacterium]